MKVARVIDDYTLVINRGSENGAALGDRVLIYAIGEEIEDPDTGESLGALELVRGTGKVTHLQPKMATVGSDMEVPPRRVITRGPGITSLFQTATETLPAVAIAFEDPEIGDRVRPL